MTAETNNLLVPVAPDPTSLSLETKARAFLPQKDYEEMVKYLEAGGKNLAQSKSSEFFELFLNGTSTHDIHVLNGKLYHHGAILLARIKDDWDGRKDEYLKRLQDGIIERLLKSKLDTINLMGDIIAAANKQHGTRIRLYLQTGDESLLKDTMAANTIQALQKAIETIAKATGEDRNINVKKTESLNLNVTTGTDSSLSVEAATKIVEIVAAEKRKKNV